MKSEETKRILQEITSGLSTVNQKFPKLTAMRQAAEKVVEGCIVKGVISPDAPIKMIQNVALTLAGVGLCQELTQRVVAEYVLRTGHANVSLIVAFPHSGRTDKGHMLAFVGELNLDKRLSMTDGAVNIGPSAPSVAFEVFACSNLDNGFIVDPSLGVVASCMEELGPISEYLNQFGSPHIYGFKNYSAIPGVSASMADVFRAAKIVALPLRQAITTWESGLSMPVTPEQMRALNCVGTLVNSPAHKLIHTIPEAGTVFFNRSWLQQLKEHGTLSVLERETGLRGIAAEL